MIGLARALGNREIGAVIGDLPGCGESLLGLDEVTIEDWREAIFRLGKDLTKDYGSPPHVASIRGGALIDHAATASSWWRFACASGQDLLRPLLRTQRISGAGNGNLFAGYPTSSRLIKELETATPEDVAGPFRECSVPVIGTPLWRRAEPDEDAALTGALADDLAQWIRTCAAA